MTEEAADSVEEVDVFAEPEFDMESAQNELTEDLFGKQEVEEAEIEDTEEDTEIEAEVEEETEEEAEEAKLDRPASWKKDTQEVWDAMSKEAQEYVIHREEQMKAGLEQDRSDSNLGRVMRDVLSPYSQIFQQNGVDEASVVRNLLNGHMAIVKADPETRVQYIKQMAQEYGVNLDGEQEGVDPRIQALQNELKSVKSYINRNQQQILEQSRERISSDVAEFAKDHEYFEELSDDIAKQISAGYDLKDAYDRAYKASDYYAEKLRQETAEKIRAESKEKAEKAKQAKSVNVRSRDTGKAPTAPKGTIDDTLNDIYRDIVTRT